MDEIEQYDFGLRLKKLRKKKKLSQTELGRKIGVTKSTIYRYESNTLSPPLDKAVELVRILDTSLDYLVGLDKSPILKLDGLSAIFVDEAQFLSSKQVNDFFLISKAMNLPVICYGLRVSFQMKAFEGSSRLLEISDELEEIPTLCKCGSIARFVSRKLNGEYEEEGPIVVIDGTTDYEYEPLCGNCYLEKVKKLDLSEYEKKLRR
ncbi:MAG: helix-turn-helix domain-containing protein [Bacilli bacterium]|nr:helix-turn-helix domain-containing protein [Bacilli bacterium]